MDCEIPHQLESGTKYYVIRNGLKRTISTSGEFKRLYLVTKMSIETRHCEVKIEK